ncbi:hypothetical protein FB451DRAFT_1272129 [Mycena latifolia]|nr:hypothetical protein FB451DRAFT_1272129 [Mycena latifolia]
MRILRVPELSVCVGSRGRSSPQASPCVLEPGSVLLQAAVAGRPDGTYCQRRQDPPFPSYRALAGILGASAAVGLGAWMMMPRLVAGSATNVFSEPDEFSRSFCQSVLVACSSVFFLLLFCGQCIH